MIHAIVERALRDVLERPASRNGRPLDVEGRASNGRCVPRRRHPMTIISGGPGTGKTTIILSILRTLRRLGVHCQEIALAAPTGKAANRMGEAIRQARRDRSARHPKTSTWSTWASREHYTGCWATRNGRAASCIMRITGWPSESSSSTKAR